MRLAQRLLFAKKLLPTLLQMCHNATLIPRRGPLVRFVLMVSFACPSCGNDIKVRDEFAGKRGKCPSCRVLVQVPAVSTDGKTMAPVAPSSAHDEVTLPPPSKGGETLLKRDSLHGASNKATAAATDQALIDFLAPKQAPDELGRLGPYRILKILGHGGMGVVYLAEDPVLKRKLAVKAMLPTVAVSASARERFAREAQAAAALEHDHIIPILRIGEDRGVPFIAMPFLKGESLEERLRRKPPVTSAEAVRIGRQAAAGLAAAHQRGLIHRDIKPANLWLEGESARVKILDFGLARSAAGESNLTQEGAIIGTPSYMAPEQAGGTVDARVDLFSLGVVLYQMFTGTLPFKGVDTVSTLVAVAMHHPDPPAAVNPRVPLTLSDFVMKLLEKEPANRPASASKVVETLAKLERQAAPGADISSEEGAASTDSITAKRRKRKRKQKRRSLLAPSAIAAAVCLLIAGAALFWNQRKERAEVRGDVPQVSSVTTDRGLDPSSQQRTDAAREKDGSRPKTDAPGDTPEPRRSKRPTREVDVANSRKAIIALLNMNPRGTPQNISPRPQDPAKAITSLDQLTDEPFVLKGLNLWGSTINDESLKVFEGLRLPSVETILLQGTNIEGDGLRYLKGADQTTTIITGMTRLTDVGVAHLNQFPSLGHLQLDGGRLTDKAAPHLGELHELRVLILNDVPISVDGAKAVSGLRKLSNLSPGKWLDDAGLGCLRPLKQLTQLDLGASQVTDGGLAPLRDLPDLSGLSLGPRIGDAGMQHVKTLSRLQQLTLDNTTVSDAGLLELKALTMVRVLRLKGTRVTSRGLDGIQEMKHLVDLDISGTQVDDEGLAKLKNNPKLGFLNLSNTRITDAGFERLQDLKNLRNVQVPQTVSEDAINRLKQALPECAFSSRGVSRRPGERPRPMR